jgi:hypothetical protein
VLKLISIGFASAVVLALASYEVLTWGEVVIASYATLGEASAAGVIDRGWLPDVLPSGAIGIAGTYDLDGSERCWQATVPAVSLAGVEGQLTSSGFNRWGGDVAPLPSFSRFRTCPFDLVAVSHSAELWRRVSPETSDFEFVSIQKGTGTFSFWSARR